MHPQPRQWIIDRAAKALSSQGYNLVRYPRANIMPLDVLAGDRSPLEWLGPIRLVWNSEAEPPECQVNDAPRFEYERSDDFKGSLGVRILQGLLRDGGTAASATAAVCSSTTLSFTYESPKQVSVAPFQVAEYLRQGDLNVKNMAVKCYLELDNALETHFYLVTEVLRARKLLVRVSGGSAESVRADTTVLQGLLPAHAEIASTRKDSTEIGIDGGADVTFAFRAYELGYVDEHWVLIGSADKTTYLSRGAAVSFGAVAVQVR